MTFCLCFLAFFFFFFFGFSSSDSSDESSSSLLLWLLDSEATADSLSLSSLSSVDVSFIRLAGTFFFFLLYICEKIYGIVGAKGVANVAAKFIGVFYYIICS